MKNIVIVDDLDKTEKWKNLVGKSFADIVSIKDFFDWLKGREKVIEAFIHLGACTSTVETDAAYLLENNYRFTVRLAEYAITNNHRFIYASSAATYGDGEFGYDDDDISLPQKLKPMNPYGRSKNDFDKWALVQNKAPFFWAGLKFFNVYGPNEFHKGRMASVVFHAFNQIKETGKVKLFRSHRPGFKDGEQMRDFIYVKDLCDVCIFLMHHRKNNGIYNLGSGKARTFKDLVNSIFAALGKPSGIEYIDTPEDIRDKYQYFTEAKMDKLKSIGYTKPFTSIEEGVKDYVQHYLEPDKHW